MNLNEELLDINLADPAAEVLLKLAKILSGFRENSAIGFVLKDNVSDYEYTILVSIDMEAGAGLVSVKGDHDKNTLN